MTEQNQLQNMFFSKDIITNLHKIVQQQTNTTAASKEDKQEIVNILVKNMKTVYKSLDLSKINNIHNYDYKKVIEDIIEINKLNINENDLNKVMPITLDLIEWLIKFQKIN